MVHSALNILRPEAAMQPAARTPRSATCNVPQADGVVEAGDGQGRIVRGPRQVRNVDAVAPQHMHQFPVLKARLRLAAAQRLQRTM